MARKKANYPLVEGLEITTLAAEGKAMGRWNDVVVFVPLTVPGDVVDVQIRSKRRRFMEGFVVRYVKKSPLRAEAFCEHFGVCGGCKWQNLPYEEQLRFKTGQVRDQLARIGKIALPEIAPCLGSARTQFYRNKLEFTFADRRWLCLISAMVICVCAGFGYAWSVLQTPIIARFGWADSGVALAYTITVVCSTMAPLSSAG